MDHDVFICHTPADQAIADAACIALEAKGIRCWIAPRDVAPPLSEAAAIEQTRIFLLVFSAAANESRQVRREVTLAADHGKDLLTLRIEKVLPQSELKFYLDGPHWLDATAQPVERYLDQLADACTAVLALEPDHVANPATATPARRAGGGPWWHRRTATGKAAVIAAVVVAVAVVAGVTGMLLRSSPVPPGRPPSTPSTQATAPPPKLAPTVIPGTGEPRAQIVQLTGSYSDEGFGNAIIDRDTRLVGLYLQAGMTATNLSGGGSAILFGFQGGQPQNGDPVELIKTFQANGFKVDDELEDGRLMVGLTDGFEPWEFHVEPTPPGFKVGPEGSIFHGTLLFWIVERASWDGPNDQDLEAIKYLVSQGADCTVAKSFLEHVGKGHTNRIQDPLPYDAMHPLLENCAN